MTNLQQDNLYQGIVCLDFDGTLFSHIGWKNGNPTLKICADEIDKWINCGWAWGINTGRSMELLLRDIDLCKIAHKPDFIVSREREIQYFNAKTRLYDLDEKWKLSCETQHDAIYLREADTLKLVKNFVESETKAKWISEPGDEAGVIATSIEEMDYILNYIDKLLLKVEDLKYLRSTVYMRFTHVAFHKGTSLQSVANKLGVGATKIVSVGDGDNDLGMLDLCFSSHIACPSNATDRVKKQVKEQGGYLAEGEASQGVYEALSHFSNLLIEENS